MRAPRNGFRIYIAGPMTGIDKYNFPAFDAAAVDLRDQGFHPVSPADIDRAHGFDPSSEADQLESHLDIDGIISRDVAALLDCEGVALLPGWQRSLGARAEVAVAMWRRTMRFWEWPSMREITPSVTVEPVLPQDAGFKLIGMTGYAGSGKDTAAEAMIGQGWQVMGFADPMYRMSMVLDPLLFRYCLPFRLSRVVHRRGWTAAKRIPAVRRWLQRLGTEAGRDVLGEEVWIDAMRRRWKPGGKYIVTNVRFPNEAQAVRAAGGKIIAVDRPGVGRANDHVSESFAIEPDAFIANVGDVDHLHMRMRETVQSLGF